MTQLCLHESYVGDEKLHVPTKQLFARVAEIIDLIDHAKVHPCFENKG